MAPLQVNVIRMAPKNDVHTGSYVTLRCSVQLMNAVISKVCNIPFLMFCFSCSNVFTAQNKRAAFSL